MRPSESKEKHILTTQPGISKKQLNDMKADGVQDNRTEFPQAVSAFGHAAARSGAVHKFGTATAGVNRGRTHTRAAKPQHGGDQREGHQARDRGPLVA